MDTLVLASTYEPVTSVCWKRAMTLWFTGRVEVLEQYDDRLVRTVSTKYQVPAVVRYVRGIRRRRPSAIRFSRRNVYARDGGCCQYCGGTIRLKEATYDHVVPRSRGGRTRWENIVLSCRACNQRKGARTPDEVGMFPLSEPSRPRSLPYPDGLRWHPTMPRLWRPYLWAA